MGGSASTVRIDRAHSHRARSASKEAGRPSRRHCHPDKIFSVIFFSFPKLVAGWKGETSSARVERAPSERARSASTEVPPPSQPSPTATPSPHTPSLADTDSQNSCRPDSVAMDLTP